MMVQLRHPATEIAAIPIYRTEEVLPEKYHVVIVEGGLAQWTGKKWLS